MQAGTDLATGFAGFLGSGWVRAGEGSDLWYMLYRFRDIATLEAWEQSRQRAWWLESGRRSPSEVRVERRTGIEGWFDAPFATHVETRGAGSAADADGHRPDPAADPGRAATLEAGGHDLARVLPHQSAGLVAARIRPRIRGVAAGAAGALRDARPHAGDDLSGASVGDADAATLAAAERLRARRARRLTGRVSPLLGGLTLAP